MSPSKSSAQISTPAQAASVAPSLPLSCNEEDLALGWECANPVLQIDAWAADVDAQPLQKFN